MVLSAYSKQRIVQLYFERRLSYANVAKVLAAEGYIVSKQTVWATITKYKTHGTLSRLPGSGRHFKLTPISRLPVAFCLPTKLGDRLQKLLTVVACWVVVAISHNDLVHLSRQTFSRIAVYSSTCAWSLRSLLHTIVYRQLFTINRYLLTDNCYVLTENVHR